MTGLVLHRTCCQRPAAGQAQQAPAAGRAARKLPAALHQAQIPTWGTAPQAALPRARAEAEGPQVLTSVYEVSAILAWLLHGLAEPKVAHPVRPLAPLQARPGSM